MDLGRLHHYIMSFHATRNKIMIYVCVMRQWWTDKVEVLGGVWLLQRCMA